MGDTGLEPSDVSTCKTKRLQNRPESGGAESGAVGGGSAQFPPDLQRVIDAWPALAGATKAGVLKLIKADETGG